MPGPVPGILPNNNHADDAALLLLRGLWFPLHPNPPPLHPPTPHMYLKITGAVKMDLDATHGTHGVLLGHASGLLGVGLLPACETAHAGGDDELLLVFLLEQLAAAGQEACSVVGRGGKHEKVVKLVVVQRARALPWVTSGHERPRPRS